MNYRFTLPIVLAFSILTAPSEAGVTITATGGSLSVGGGSLIIPVMISTDGSDTVTEINVAYDIKADSANASTPVASLEFVTPSSAATDPTLNSSSYIYNPLNPDLVGTASFKLDLSPPQVFGIASDPSSIGFNTHFAGADIYDGTDDGAVLVSGKRYLLTNLVISFAGPATTNAAGDLFDITLHLGSTYFKDGSGNAVGLIDPTLEDSTIATVLVTSTVAQAVPEPSSLVMCVLGFVFCTAHIKRMQMR